MSNEKPYVAEIFKCCMIDGQYLGTGLHDPDTPGDGPWYLTLRERDAARLLVELGFGTKQEARAALQALVQPQPNDVEILDEDSDDDPEAALASAAP